MSSVTLSVSLGWLCLTAMAAAREAVLAENATPRRLAESHPLPAPIDEAGGLRFSNQFPYLSRHGTSSISKSSLTEPFSGPERLRHRAARGFPGLRGISQATGGARAKRAR